jgi:hypothetical protein
VRSNFNVESVSATSNSASGISCVASTRSAASPERASSRRTGCGKQGEERYGVVGQRGVVTVTKQAGGRLRN